jgi:predicted metalloendopeptidase
MSKPDLATDFYGHCNFEWLQSNQIPSQYSKWGNFNVLNEINQERLKNILETTPENEEQTKLNIMWSKGLETP